MITETFYVGLAGICFTLLGLWWLVLTAQHTLWMPHPERRRLGYHLSLYFALPGAMSLVSLLTPASPFFWRGGFVLMGLVGALESVHLQMGGKTTLHASRIARAVLPVITVLYLIISVLAISPSIPESLGIDVEPTAVEGVFLVLLLMFGINLAWLGFMGVSLEGEPPESNSD